MPKEIPTNVTHTSPSPVIQNTVNQSWGGDQPKSSIQEAINQTPVKHPIDIPKK